jgi:hypothetical protein
MTLTTYAHVIRELKGEPVVSAEEQIEEARRGVGSKGGVNREVEAGEWRRTRVRGADESQSVYARYTSPWFAGARSYAVFGSRTAIAPAGFEPATSRL